MISEMIKKDINDEFRNLQDSLQRFFQPDVNISTTKTDLETHLPKEVVVKSEILMDTLVNYLMEDARKRLKNTDIAMQNTFFDANLRKRTQDWAKQPENRLALNPTSVMFRTDPRIKNSVLLGVASFLIGILATALLPINENTITMAVGNTTVSWNLNVVVSAIIVGVITIFVALLSFKHYSQTARECLMKDTDHYLDTAQAQVTDWLRKIEDFFENDFHSFCQNGGLLLEGENK